MIRASEFELPFSLFASLGPGERFVQPLHRLSVAVLDGDVEHCVQHALAQFCGDIAKDTVLELAIRRFWSCLKYN